jgi:putative ABC transport system permease protein
MTLPRMAWRYLWARPLATAATLAGVALGTALVAATLTLHRGAGRAFQAEAGLFDLVVGAKGSPLQTVLSSVYHLDLPTGNIPRAEFDRLAADRRVAHAIPLGLGDNFRGHRIVGTTAAIRELRRRGDASPLLQIASGRWFGGDFEAVLGADAARATGLRPGDTFSGSHGLVPAAGAAAHDSHPYTVTGILAPSGTAQDRAIFCSLESVWKVHEADPGAPPDALQGLRRDAPAAAAGREVTAVLVQLASPGLRLWLANEINRGTSAQAAIPLNEMLRLSRRLLDPLRAVLVAVAAAVVAVSMLSVAATLLLAAERRRRDAAVLRCLGARRSELLALGLLEALWLAGAGVVLGWLAGHGALACAAGLLESRAGLRLAPWSSGADELKAMLAILAAGLAAGLVPAVAAFRRTPAADLDLDA